MILEASDLPEGRFAGKLNDGRFFAVDSGFGDFFSGQERGKDFKGVAIVAFELLTIIGHVDLSFEKHKLFDAVDNGGELDFAGVGVVVVDLAGESAIDDAGRDEAVADVIFADGDAKDGEVELLDRLGEGEGRMLVDEDSEGRKDFAEFLVTFNLDEIFGIALAHVLEHFVCEGGNFFGEAVVGKENSFGGVNLNIFFTLNDMHGLNLLGFSRGFFIRLT